MFIPSDFLHYENVPHCLSILYETGFQKGSRSEFVSIRLCKTRVTQQ